MSFYTVAGLPYSDELRHHGIKGQKWGIRRFENPDGTLTPAGKERYSDQSNSNSSLNKGKKVERQSYKNGHKGLTSGQKKAIIVGASAVAAGLAVYGLHKSGVLNGRTLKVGSNVLFNKKENTERQNYKKRLVGDAVNVHKMSDAELLEKIGRLSNEKKLMDLTVDRLTSSADPKKNMMIQAGKKIAGAALTGIGTYAGFATITGEFNPKTLASYMFANPNKKK